MSRSAQTLGTVVKGAFCVYDSSNNAITGLTTGNFTILVAIANANASKTVTITEIGNGRYGYSVTLDTAGYWYIVIRHATYNPRGEDDEFDVS